MRDTAEVVVSLADLKEVVFDGTIIIVTGTAGNTRVTFVGDARPVRSLLYAVAESGREQTVEVEAWQIVHAQPITGGGR